MPNGTENARRLDVQEGSESLKDLKTNSVIKFTGIEMQFRHAVPFDPRKSNGIQANLKLTTLIFINSAKCIWKNLLFDFHLIRFTMKIYIFSALDY